MWARTFRRFSIATTTAVAGYCGYRWYVQPPTNASRALPQRGDATNTAPGDASAAALSSSAALLGQGIGDAVVQNAETTDQLVALIVDTFLHPKVVRTLKDVFVDEFTENDVTLAALRRLIVTDVIQDPVVSRDLIAFSKDLGLRLVAEPEVWPGRTADVLVAAALEGLADERFKREAIACIKASVY